MTSPPPTLDAQISNIFAERDRAQAAKQEYLNQTLSHADKEAWAHREAACYRLARVYGCIGMVGSFGAAFWPRYRSARLLKAFRRSWPAQKTYFSDGMPPSMSRMDRFMNGILSTGTCIVMGASGYVAGFMVGGMVGTSNAMGQEDLETRERIQNTLFRWEVQEMRRKADQLETRLRTMEPNTSETPTTPMPTSDDSEVP